MICSDASVPRRLLTTLLTTLLLATVVTAGLSAGASAAPGVASAQAPECPSIDVEAHTKAALAVFTGTVTKVVRQTRTDGQTGALYLHTVTVSRVYQGDVRTETVQVQTDRNRLQCSLGELATGEDYMFFVSGTGAPWLASGISGTRPANSSVVASVEELLGQGKPPVEPAPEEAVFTPVDVAEPQTLSRSAAPGAALVLIGLLGLLLVRGLARRSR